MPRQSEDQFPRPVRNIEVAPGVIVPSIRPLTPDRIPALGVFEWRQVKLYDAKGRTVSAFIPVERVEVAWLRISEAVKLWLGLSKEVICRLVAAGFVEGGRAAPSSATVNVWSLLKHIEDTREDWQYWERDGRRDRYRNALTYAQELAVEQAEEAVNSASETD
jgi:hypothetical protein